MYLKVSRWNVNESQNKKTGVTLHGGISPSEDFTGIPCEEKRRVADNNEFTKWAKNWDAILSRKSRID